MDHSYLLMDSFVTRLLQDNAALLWNTTWNPNRPPIAISMASRLVSSTGQSLAPGQEQEQAQARAQLQAQAQAQAQADAAFSGHDIRQPPLHPLPLAQPTPSRSQQHPSNTTTTALNDAIPNYSTPPRNRNRPPPSFITTSSNLWHPEHVVDLWDVDNDDELLNLTDPFSTSQPGSAFINNDLSGFADVDFSSPSSYPPFTEQPTPRVQRSSHNQTLPLEPLEQASRPLPSAPCPSASTAPRNANNPSGACILNLDFTAPQRSTTQLSSSTTTGESQSTLHTFDSFDEPGLFDSPLSSFSDTMPEARRRAQPAAHDSVHASKRRRTSINASTHPHSRPPSRRKHDSVASKDFDDLLFEPGQPPNTPGAEARSGEFTTIDLTEANVVPEELTKPFEDKRIKLAAFQCVICMDDVSILTVTHCGHLYCAQCLHSSLHVEATKGKCPMCRQKLDMRTRETYNSKTKGFWPLELKLMTATRKGKRKANTQL
ncbi:hypothetical protein B0J13DRAFT_117933 [Dactylonectria estremocensis]|uniref:RING-type domain-containing protein n=1 Tax=Dactylonectria estremocensis TaxID=1079267 RepID=A0A9P9JIA6_9HYPO|nr:hypothetical protein B0J13DRAFT_117933 [Dactylonectria estremocensis]